MVRCQDCGISIEPIDDDLADELSLDGLTDVEIDFCHTHCDRCRIDILIARDLAEPGAFKQLLDALRGGKLQ